MKIKILIVDDHFVFRKGMISLLQVDKRIEITGEAENGLEAIDFLKNNKPDVIFLDLEMPIKNGYEVLKFIKKNCREVRVIVLSMLDNLDDISKSMKHGANAFISKAYSEKDLIDAIDSVMKGETFICRKSVKALKSNGTKSALISALTEREIEIIKFVALGLSTKEIAEKLFRSELTINTHRKNINAKLNLHSPIEISIFAIRNGLVEPDKISILN